ncbi:fibronectin type III domain-containing protein [Bacillus sp. RO3]|nr:fibronectin type III domain-containing protein [Bacillus sp. RO3]
MNLTASNITSTGLTVSWSQVTYDNGISNYEIFRNGISVGTSKTLSFTDSGLTADTTYEYAVKVIGADGQQSKLSEKLAVATLPSV